MITVTRVGSQLFLEDPDDPRDEYYPESNQDFFSKTADGQITFKTNRQGRATEFVFHGNGTTKRYKRID